MHAPDDYKELKLKLDGIVPAGLGFHRNLLFEAMYASLPRDPQVRVQIYNAEIVPGGFTNWHCHNGAAFFVALDLPYLCIGLCFTSPDREHVTNSVERPW
jgi:hypothetical protein